MNTSSEEAAPAVTSDSSMSEMPSPTKEHAWLEKFIGEWETEAEMFCAPDQPPMRSTGVESTRWLGDFWIIGQGRSDSPEMPFSSVLTLGYDPKKQKYVGSWVDSMTSTFWKYEGEVNEAGTTLTLRTEAECPGIGQPGKVTKFREITEFLSPDQRVFHSEMQGENGEWRTVLKVNFRRKK